jgi:hypothetical protein
LAGRAFYLSAPDLLIRMGVKCGKLTDTSPHAKEEHRNETSRIDYARAFRSNRRFLRWTGPDGDNFDSD